ncbi:hypothetical protein UG55_101038 [Frankia sp. EI5c]|uniref:hypothetical protein n=1 Tax=Frankia sp. EI5c TaxID=683316 RepID=UPI0007C356B3|nr:hypothetical protein [Frankia sp. EI5c]OAA27024.1 hypothetical protein UG55_101038 [Frankia sp. EI5c]
MNTVDTGALTPEPRPVSGGPPPSLAEVVTVRAGLVVEHELILAPGATAADLTSAMILVPPTAALVSHHGDVDLSLVFREVPRRAPEETTAPR